MELIEIVAFCIFEVVGPVVALSFRMKELDMKQVFKHSLLGILLITLFASVCFADVGQTIPLKSETDYRPKGFHLGGAVSMIVPFTDGWVVPLRGKLDFIVGYQFNPYISLDVKLSTLWFIGWQAAASTKINFTNTRISPFITGSIGGAGTYFSLEEEGDFNIITATTLYTAGAGVDFGLTKRSTIYAMFQIAGIPLEYGILPVPEIGYQLLF